MLFLARKEMKIRKRRSAEYANNRVTIAQVALIKYCLISILKTSVKKSPLQRNLDPVTL
jgi:hypothetical protein